ncbi:Cyclohexanone 1,2-monooxygenase [Colletotrichum siamense]|uniref:Cyclohexanone 1,2-monooxygenase n=1 Tax=Colletotrichum siamense TaxID=690259 RepID=A0A9P5EJY1_COLSI|nr:Cyclohexanone 1,2-monooxygenase [Colletotrichum siamense]KAF4852175.1 Cyclohexanone 1,2-monooxygenase [Colletotrichum siamense]
MAEIIEIDALVVGTGFGGIYATYRLATMRMNVQTIDVAPDIGGTWYWNRYPGAMSDTETYLYRYSWDKGDLQTYPWTHHYVYQPEILNYLQHIVKRHDLRKYMKFNCEMKSATWDDTSHRWHVACSTGEVYHARYLVNSLGILSKANHPDIPGLSNFQGSLLHTAKWDDTIQLEGKRVGIIGNGSTGVQVMTAIAPKVAHLDSFQRHPQYSVPSGQGPIAAEYRKKINEDYDKIWDDVWSSAVGFGVPESTRRTMEASPEERKEAFEEVWSKGNGFRFMFSAFGDLTTNEAANKEACNFIRSKIDQIVKDPAKANILKPKELYARRPLCDSGYYEIFNRDNVDVIDIQANPIKQITKTGIELMDGKPHDMDILIFATGFDAIEGSYSGVCITGRDGKTLKDHWRNGLKAYGAIACSGFPNMFLISGPQGPFANFPPVIESETNFIMSLIEHAEALDSGRKATPNGNTNGKTNVASGTSRTRPTTIEVSEEAEQDWAGLCDSLVQESVFLKSPSWIFSRNIPGRKPNTNFYFAGLRRYLEWVSRQKSAGFPAFAKGWDT